MIKTGPQPYRLTIVLQEDAYEGFPTQTVEVKVEMTDGQTATLARFQTPFGEVGNLPSDLQDLADAWLFGEGLKPVLVQCQRWDRTRQAKRVRATLL